MSTSFLVKFKLFLILSTLIFADLTKAKTTYVTDGDTFHVLIDGKKEKIRMFGIDAPESKQEWGCLSSYKYFIS